MERTVLRPLAAALALAVLTACETGGGSPDRFLSVGTGEP